MSERKPGELPVFDKATEIAFDQLVATVMVNIVTVAPFFAAPGLNFITKKVVAWVLMFAWFPMTTFVAFFIIDAEREAKRKAYDEATKELDEVIKNNSDLNSEEVKKAHEEFKKKLGALIRVKPR